MGYQEEVCDLMAENGALRARVATAENCTKAQEAEIERLAFALQASESLKRGYLDELDRLRALLKPFSAAAANLVADINQQGMQPTESK